MYILSKILQIYFYIYTYIHTCIYICVYIHTHTNVYIVKIYSKSIPVPVAQGNIIFC